MVDKNKTEQIIIKNAKDARNEALKANKYEEWSYEDVIKKVASKVKDGKMELRVDPGYISPETKEKLEKSTFSVITMIWGGVPYFVVRWDGHKI